MNDYFNLTTLFALLGLLGLAFDIWGVLKLFSVEPIQIRQVDKAIFGATLENWNNEEKTEYLINQLNEQISQVNNENKKRSKKAQLYRRFLIIGFSIQKVTIPIFVDI